MTKTVFRHFCTGAFLVSLLSFGVLPVNGQEIVLREGLAIRVGQSSRSPIYQDPVLYRMAYGEFSTPVEGQPVEEGGEAKWERITVNEEGYFAGRSLRGGYLYIPVEVKKTATMILEASGHNAVYVNGEPRSGDVYDYGWIRYPITLKKGRNDLLFQVARGRVRARLTPVERELSLTTLDMTVPDIIIGESEPVWAAIRVINAGRSSRRDLVISARVAGGETRSTDVPVVGPMTSRKVGFEISFIGTTETRLPVTVILHRRTRKGLQPLDETSFELDVVRPDQHHRRTFISEIDGSVQYYSVVPGGSEPGRKPALFLSLHGASVEAVNQARAYKSKGWGHIVAPTNRRPYGFDWEDWGRLDALEVLEQVQEKFDTDPLHTYLTGHSMGGHGTWIFGATYPDRFAAIAPICGWYSFWSYVMRGSDQPTPFQQEILRASNISQTLGLSKNYLNHGVYIVHGQIDETVPVEQARFMKRHLAEFHPDFAYKEVPGAGHWWGDESVDFAPVFDYFRWHTRKTKAGVDTLHFSTANPGVSARAYFATIAAQQRPLEFSTITIAQDTSKGTLTGKTENVARLVLDLDQFVNSREVSVELDGQRIDLKDLTPGTEKVWLERVNESWRVTSEPARDEKGPHRYGTFKDGFRHHVVFVYGTKGTREENAWAYNKARFDAETFWYRGNGSVDVVADTDFDAASGVDRSVVLYGHADMNAAWKGLLGNSPVQVQRGEVRIDDRTLEGEDLGCLFIRPRPGSDIASISVVAGTGMPGLTTAYPNPYFVAGAGYPDLFVFNTDMLKSGEEGVRAWGYFGVDWSVENGEWVMPDIDTDD